VRIRLIGLKNERPAALIAAGLNPFDENLNQKVFETERSVLVSRESSVTALY
jgi:hypothetical protein